ALLISSMRIAREPASLIISAERAASPSFPGGSFTEPVVKSSFIITFGRTDFWVMNGMFAVLVPSAAWARLAMAGAFVIASGSGSFESVVTTRFASVKYLFAVAWMSAGV